MESTSNSSNSIKSNSNIVICFSGIKANTPHNIYNITYEETVHRLNCVFSSSMDVSTVSYLVLGKVGQDKHLAALKYSIPCVTVSICI